MLDPDILREKPQEVRRMLEKRSVEFDIDGLLAASRTWHHAMLYALGKPIASR